MTEAHTEALVAAGLLDARQTDNLAAMSNAIAKLLDVLAGDRSLHG